MSLAHYSPEEVVFLLGGVVQIDGFADGTFITIRKSTPVYETVVSADGKVSRTQVDNPLYTVTLTLAATASSNELLGTIAFADRKTNKAKMPLLIRDHFGNSLFYASLAWIEGIPDTTYTTEVSSRDWTFSCIGVTNIIGGNEGTNPVPDFLAALGLEGMSALF